VNPSTAVANARDARGARPGLRLGLFIVAALAVGCGRSPEVHLIAGAIEREIAGGG
jgi:hypothetical protein